MNGRQLGDYLFVPGIYGILPLLAVRGKEGNPFFIDEKCALEMVREIIAALDLRARDGRQ